ncbi:hypothetical protein QFZ24_010053 [Streptomyces phaeochromogenes]|uniref:hypothetical protein n=1 Tax=Streptomyces phaeochromogenes TaxID=1923 RepID=UPI0027902A29|nr:hypothetical protein [Streptomyces phaeochromogenes]MDQ0956044.1 hypothetical protein [Streptomyces phaeochromogenes]
MRRIVTASALAAAFCLTFTACSDSDDRSDPQPSPRTALKLGQGSGTAGVDGKGTVKITADSVAYVRRAGSATPEHDLFAVLRYDATNRSKTPVTSTADTGGFRWKTSDGHTVNAGNTRAAQGVFAFGSSEGGATVPPKVNITDTVAFDITTAQKGATLIYVDGDGITYRWKIPPTSSGSTASALESALQ